jgi:CheY-like chemotaxis protein
MFQCITILVVDDHEISCTATAFLVKAMGYQADRATSGKEALAKIKTRRYSGIVMDYQMPGMNGLDCARQIREQDNGINSRIPIIVFTADKEPGLKEMCMNAGIDACLEKTYSTDDLEKTLKTLLLRTAFKATEYISGDNLL